MYKGLAEGGGVRSRGNFWSNPGDFGGLNLTRRDGALAIRFDRIFRRIRRAAMTSKMIATMPAIIPPTMAPVSDLREPREAEASAVLVGISVEVMVGPIEAVAMMAVDGLAEPSCGPISSGRPAKMTYLGRYS